MAASTSVALFRNLAQSLGTGVAGQAALRAIKSIEAEAVAAAAAGKATEQQTEAARATLLALCGKSGRTEEEEALVQGMLTLGVPQCVAAVELYQKEQRAKIIYAGAGAVGGIAAGLLIAWLVK